MSAWIPDKAHIDLLVDALFAHAEPVGIHATLTRTQVGQELVEEVVRSVRARYPDAVDLPGPEDPYYEQPYGYQDHGITLTPSEQLELSACYRYQACEHPEWPNSSAECWTRALEAQLPEEPEGDGPWGWDVVHVAARQKAEAAA